MLFSTKDQDNNKVGIKKWLKENDKIEKARKVRSKNICESQREVPDLKQKEKSSRKEMVVHIPR